VLETDSYVLTNLSLRLEQPIDNIEVTDQPEEAFADAVSGQPEDAPITNMASPN